MTNRIISRVFLTFVCLFTLPACSKQPQYTTMTCESQKYLGNGYILDIADDGDTLNTIKITFNIDEEYLKTEKKLSKTLNSIDDLYTDYENAFYNEYLMLTQGNENLPYFAANFDTNANDHTIKVTYTYKVNNPVFLKTVKNPSTNMYEWINYYALMDAYDSEKEVFSFKKLKGSHRYQGIEKIKCKETTDALR